MDCDLRRTLLAVGELMAVARRPWMIIGSAAAALHGARPIQVADVDVLLDPADALRLLPTLGLSVAPGTPDRRFRSDVFASWARQPLGVEFMAGFQWHDGNAWRLLEPASPQAIYLDDVRLFVPALADLKVLFRGFGRPKDLERARLLDAFA